MQWKAIGVGREGERFKQKRDVVSVVIAFKTLLYMLCVKHIVDTGRSRSRGIAAVRWWLWLEEGTSDNAKK